MFGKHIAQREPEHPSSGDFLRDIVFGANDGVVTAIGFLVGIAGSISDQAVIVIAGVLTIVAGAASMALGNYLGVKSQREFYEQMEEVERWEIEHEPDREREEVSEIYQNMGFGPGEVKLLTDKVTGDREMWLKVMMRDELGLSQKDKVNPVFAGSVMGFFYLVGGIPPLLPFILVRPVTRALLMSIIAAILVMAMIGAIRWFLNRGSLGGKVVETIVIGVIAALVGFLAGEALTFFGITGISIS